MAIAAINAVLSNVMLVAERHRLIERHANIRRVWRPEDFVCRPACAADQNDSAKNCDTGMDVRVSREDLSHEKRFFFANKSRVRAGRDACNYLLAHNLLSALIDECQRSVRPTCEFEACQLGRRRIDIFCQRENLKGATKHFRMEQRLQFALYFCAALQHQVARFRNDSRKKMMLIGEPGYAQAI